MNIGERYGGHFLHTLPTFALGPEEGSATSLSLALDRWGWGFTPSVGLKHWSPECFSDVDVDFHHSLQGSLVGQSACSSSQGGNRPESCETFFPFVPTSYLPSFLKFMGFDRLYFHVI